jgi:2-dehydro-3-deoxyphosphogluconate aldolase/(4S)-4-hydroxy-2-oxoglutarate aldolase
VTATEAALATARVLPVIRGVDADAALRQAERIVAAGFEVLELTATIPGWPAALAAARREWPHVLLGAGTLTAAADAERAAEAGADFLVSPWPAPEVRAVATRRGLLFVEGGFTAAEVAAAARQGPAKLFPAHVGGPAYLRSLLAVLPGAAIVPTGGVAVEAIPEYLDAGAVAVGVGADRLEGVAA